MFKFWIIVIVVLLIYLSLLQIDLNHPPGIWLVAAMLGISVTTIASWVDKAF